MVLLLRRDEVDGILNLSEAIEVTKTAVLEEVEGTTVRMPPFGGMGWGRRILRVVGGGLFGIGRFGIRAGDLALLFDAETSEALAIMDLPTGDLRLAASVALGAQYLARPDARNVALIGSGTVAFSLLRGLCAARQVENVGVYSPNAEHRLTFAARAGIAFGIAVTAHDNPDAMLADADIVATATNARTPVVHFERLRPGTHVSSAGLNFELDRSIYENADQLVATSRQQEVASAMPADTPGRVTGGPLYDLLSSGALVPESIVELGAIVRGDLPARNGRADINVYRESRGGIGDAVLASRAYDIARERGLGVEIDLPGPSRPARNVEAAPSP